MKNAAVTDFIKSTGFGVTAFQMFFFAGFAFVAALVFGLVARRYRAGGDAAFDVREIFEALSLQEASAFQALLIRASSPL